MNTKQITLNEELADMVDRIYPPEMIEVIAESIIEANPNVSGLEIGAIAPDFTLRNTNGEEVNLYEILENNAVVLSFFRGEWCPYCSLEVMALQKALPQIEALGAVVLTIHPQRIDTSFRLKHKHQLSYQILNDPSQEVLEKYNVKFELPESIHRIHIEFFDLDVSKMNENGELTLPVPATFIIDRDKTIRSRFFSPDYTTRIEPSDILKALQNMPDLTPAPYYKGILGR